jgi:hypothetical protein
MSKPNEMMAARSPDAFRQSRAVGVDPAPLVLADDVDEEGQESAVPAVPDMPAR